MDTGLLIDAIVQQHGPILRNDLLRHFHLDDHAVLRSAVVDLVDSGLVDRIGRDDATRLQAADLMQPTDEAEGRLATLEAMVLVALHRSGPLAAAGLAAREAFS